jgi:zinc protease
MPHRILTLYFVLLTALLQGIANSNAVAGNTTFTLPNGLRVILRPVAGHEEVAIVTFFDIGSKHDPPGASGLAHYLEHLYTTAATGRSPVRTVEEFARAYQTGWNAETGDDYTMYATVVEPVAFVAELQNHADRMDTLKVAPSDLQRELPRIDRELANMFERYPMLAAMNVSRERVRPTPNGGRRGGRIDELKKVTLDQLQSRWQAYYKPRNAILAIAGDLDKDSSRTTIENAFGKLPAGETLPASNQSTTVDPPPEPLEIVATKAGDLPQAELTFVTPPSDSPDFAPLLVFVTRLVHSHSNFAAIFRPSTNFRVNYALLNTPDYISIAIEPQPNESVQDVEQRLRDAVANAKKVPWEQHELGLTKEFFAFMFDTAPLPDSALAKNIYGVAFSAGRRHQLGFEGHELANKIDRVTAADVTRIADKYFSPSQGACVLVRSADK